MPLLRSVYYRVPLAAGTAARHMVPLEAARQLVNEPTALPSCLNDHLLLGQVTILAGEKVISTSPEVLVRTQGDSEVTFPSEFFRSFSPSTRADVQLVVRLVLLTGPFGHETATEV